MKISKINLPCEEKLQAEFDEIIKDKLGNSITVVQEPDKTDPDLEEAGLDEDDDAGLVLPEEDPVDYTGKAVYQQPFTYMLISTDVLLPLEGEFKKVKVKERSMYESGEQVGTYDTNPLFNSIIYDVKFPDG